MLRKSKRVCLSPDHVNEKPSIFVKHGGSRVMGNKKRVTGSWTFRVSKDTKFSPVRYLLRLGAKVASALRVVSMRRRSSSRKVSSSTNSINSPHSLPSNHTDSHRAKAVQDCIEFLHSCSTRERPS